MGEINGVTHIIGKLGSGKTLYAVKQIIDTLLNTDKEVYTNVRLNDFWDYTLSETVIHGLSSTVKYFLAPFADRQIYRAWMAGRYAKRYHYYSSLQQLVEVCQALPETKEHTRFFVWDEIHLELHSRQWKNTMMEVIDFFTKSRKNGFDVLFITQLKSALDRQVRDLAECVYELKNLSNWRPLGYKIFPHVGILSKRYSDANSDAGMKKGMFMGFEFIRYGSRYTRFYNTMQKLFSSSVPLPAPKLWSSEYSERAVCASCGYMSFFVKWKSFVDEFKPEAPLKKRDGVRCWAWKVEQVPKHMLCRLSNGSELCKKYLNSL
jgi:hypothetical protein